MDTFEYVVGFTLLALIICGFAVTALRLRVALVGNWTGAPALLVWIVLGIATAVVTSELLGVLGLLSTPAIVVASLAPAAALSHWKLAPGGGSAPPAVKVGRLMLALAATAALVTAIHWAGPVLRSLDVGIYRQDSLWYHLPTAAWFAQTGSVGGLLFTDPLKLAVWYYPDNSELIHSLGMVVLDNDFLSPLLNFGWMAVALLAGWCIGRPLGLAPVTLLAVVLVLDSDMMLVQAGNAPSDVMALACLLAAIAVLVNAGAVRSSGATGHPSIGSLAIAPPTLAIAALACGLAVGTKVTMLVPVGVLTIAVIVASRADRGRRAAIWLGGLLATGGFWYLRNLIHAGNPLPWINAGPLPGPHQEDLYPRPANSVASYLSDSHAWTDFFFPGLADTLGPLWPLVVFAAFAGIVLGLRRRQPGPVRVLALAAAATALAYIFIPISASGANGVPAGFASNFRYAAPALAIGLVLLPLCETRAIANRLILPAYTLIAAVSAIDSAEWVQPQLIAALAIGLAVVLLPLWVLREPRPRRRLLVLVGVSAAALLAGYAQQRQYFEDRFQPGVAPPLDNPGFRASEQWQSIQSWALEQHNLRIGIVGSPAAYGQYVFYGDDLSNEVRYLGEPRSHGGYGPITTCEEWNEALRAGHFDVVVVTPEDPGIALLPPQFGWTRLGRGALPALLEPPAAVYRIVRAPDPTACNRPRRGIGPEGFLPPGIPAPRGVPVLPEAPG
ncbi:MAG TPA: hypothetical protein VF081_06645 [Solirubrobacterales bacterium]